MSCLYYSNMTTNPSSHCFTYGACLSFFNIFNATIHTQDNVSSYLTLRTTSSLISL